PFFLLYMMPPWFDSVDMGYRFEVSRPSEFLRAFARRSFMQFTASKAPVKTICDGVAPDITMGDAAPLLSAILFASGAQPVARDQNARIPAWLYSNPRAKHRVLPGN